jgi:hypothetical protein
MTLGKGDSDNYFIMKYNITGGLSNTHHRLNIAGESEITKVKIGTEGLEIDHTNNIINHVWGLMLIGYIHHAFLLQLILIFLILKVK